MSVRHWTLIIVVAATLALAVGLRLWFPPVEGGLVRNPPNPLFDELDPWVQSALFDEQQPVVARYENLFRYLVAGFLAYRSNDDAHAYYPGLPSDHGHQIDALEGFARMAPLMAAWLRSGRPATVDIPAFGEVDLSELLRHGIEQGTDPEGDFYWGDIGQRDQRVVEAADIALAIWMARDSQWDPLAPAVRDRIADWLHQTAGKADSIKLVNWHLFPMIANRVLNALGVDSAESDFADDWRIVKESYLGEGWFSDDEGRGVDYYNAWSFQYGLYWLSQIDPGFDDGFITSARREFVAFYKHFITPLGVPIFGRSICYRTAVTVPLIIAAATDPDAMPAGQARRAFDRSWRYFVSHSGLQQGVLTQGYCQPDIRIVDRYSGPASCLWGARSLLLALLQPSTSAFWQAAEQPLPVESSDFDLHSQAAGLRLVGEQRSGVVTVYRDGYHGNPPLKSYGWRQEFAEWLFQRPFRSPNGAAKYKGEVYRSDPPFCGCDQSDAKLPQRASPL